MRKLISCVAVLALAINFVGCSGLQTAQKASAVIGAVLAVAAAEVNVVPLADQASYKGFVTLGQSLETQLNACIAGVAGVSKSKGFLVCFNDFASGLSSPAELAQLKLLSANTQSKVQLYLVGIIAGVNVAVSYFGGAAVNAPSVAPPPSAADLNQLQIDVTHQLVLMNGR